MVTVQLNVTWVQFQSIHSGTWTLWHNIKYLLISLVTIDQTYIWVPSPLIIITFSLFMYIYAHKICINMIKNILCFINLQSLFFYQGCHKKYRLLKQKNKKSRITNLLLGNCYVGYSLNIFRKRFMNRFSPFSITGYRIQRGPRHPVASPL